MCEAHAYILKNGEEEVLLENVDQVEVEGDEEKKRKGIASKL